MGKECLSIFFSKKTGSEKRVKINSQTYLLKKIIVLLCLCLTIKNYAQEEDNVKHLWEGNLALPASQQPGSLVAFGQNIIDKNDFLIYFEYEHIKGKQQKSDSIIPHFLYGIDNNSSLFISVPIAIDLKSDNQHSSGIGDITVQYEYAFFTKNRPSYTTQATVVGNIGLPTGSFKKQPPTGFGAPSFFLGTTLSYTGIEWYAFISPGADFTTSHNGNKAGNEYLYLGGFGKNIAYRSKEWILTWIIEFDGLYAKRDKRNNIIDQNSGGNTIVSNFLLWFSTEKLVLLGSVAVPITQRLFGQQNKNNYFIDVILGWKFN